MCLRIPRFTFICKALGYNLNDLEISLKAIYKVLPIIRSLPTYIFESGHKVERPGSPAEAFSITTTTRLDSFIKPGSYKPCRIGQFSSQDLLAFCKRLYSLHGGMVACGFTPNPDNVM